MVSMALDDSYQRLKIFSEPEEDRDNNQETPQDSGVVIQVIPESAKSRWSHVEDLDTFFTRMYYYHQKHGFFCMMIQKFLELAQFVYIIFFSVFLLYCVDYSILFKDKLPDNHHNKTALSDAILPSKQCVANISLFSWIAVFISCIFWFFRLIKVLYHFFKFLDIKSFYNSALNIQDEDLDNLTWHDVQKKVIEVQKEHQMCIHKPELTELDIYQRILRFKNYMVAMINKSLIPVHLTVPVIGDIIFMTRGYTYNLELLFFRGPWSPFKNNWHLKEDYKKLNKRRELARALSKMILLLGIVNLLLSPIILFWQVLYFFYTYVEMLKREPGSLGARTWSSYGKWYLRHFNELDHELNARLNRAYRPAAKYMNMFTSPIITVFAKNIAFLAGSVLAVFVMFALYDEDFLSVEHVLMISTLLGSIVAISRSLIPDENLVWCPESLLTAVLAHTHYRPDSWRNQACTKATRAQVAQLFQYKAVHLLEELVSPLMTPYLLIFHLRHRALDIVDFFRSFSIDVTGVGDVCSFAQMDVRKHGNPMWQTITQNQNIAEQRFPFMSKEYTAEEGKTELSLIHFTLTNPEWKLPSSAENFVTALRERAMEDITNGYFVEDNPLYYSLNSLSSLGYEYNGVVNNILQTSGISQPTSIASTSNTFRYRNQQTTDMSANVSVDGQHFSRSRYSNTGRAEVTKTMRCNVSKAEGSLHVGERGLLHSLYQSTSTPYQSCASSMISSRHQEMDNEAAVLLELTAIDMSLATLYMHELHYRQVDKHNAETSSIRQPNTAQELRTFPESRQERQPLLQHQDTSIRNKNS